MNVAIKKEFQGLIQRTIDDESDGKKFKITPSMVVHMALENMYFPKENKKKTSQPVKKESEYEISDEPVFEDKEGVF